MARIYIFADEAGNFDFSRKARASRYFIVTTVVMRDCSVAADLLLLRRELAWQKRPIGDYFHATEDKQAIRNVVFDAISKRDFDVYATILEKSKAQPQTRTTNARFYQYAWLYLFRYGVSRVIKPDSELLITAAAIATKKGQAEFTGAVNDVTQQTIKRSQWSTYFCPCATDPCLQVADYCTWAIQRKWERGDTKSYDLIKDHIRYEYELWQLGTHHYY